MTTQIQVSGYSPIRDEPEAHTIIEICGTPPDATNDRDWLKDMEKFYKQEAERLATALIISLPGGTMHALTVRLLEHRVNVLRVKESNHE